ncbi:MAG: OmpA family protein [Burkholderiales bacterium]|nr:OmpA family protein [Burkholderiales bacterium]
MLRTVLMWLSIPTLWLCHAGVIAQSGPDDARTVLGEWVGTYTCAQGLTGLTLTIAEATPTSTRALFHFYADPRNPRVPTGCFTMDGSYDPASGRLLLKGGKWLQRPSGYRVVSFDGSVDAEGRRFEGRVKGPQGCTTFDLVREPSPAPPLAQCALPDAPAAQPDQASAGVIAEALAGDGRIDLNILFDFAQASIRADGAGQLDELGRILMSPALAQRRIGIYGHTDAVGTAEANRLLSIRRATAVRDYLVQRFKADAGRFEVQGFGEDRLKLPESPEDETNRRVEIVVLD